MRDILHRGMWLHKIEMEHFWVSQYGWSLDQLRKVSIHQLAMHMAVPACLLK